MSTVQVDKISVQRSDQYAEAFRAVELPRGKTALMWFVGINDCLDAAQVCWDGTAECRWEGHLCISMLLLALSQANIFNMLSSHCLPRQWSVEMHCAMRWHKVCGKLWTYTGCFGLLSSMYCLVPGCPTIPSSSDGSEMFLGKLRRSLMNMAGLNRCTFFVMYWWISGAF